MKKLLLVIAVVVMMVSGCMSMKREIIDGDKKDTYTLKMIGIWNEAEIK